ncbi:phosphotransferase enzyme family protein [Flindersiella endophytica]
MTLDLSAWDLPVPLDARQPDRGSNNLVWLIDDTYVLRIYQNLEVSRIEAELRLLEALRAVDGLPFAVPVPIASSSGRAVVGTVQGPAVLFPLLPGRTAERTDPHEIELTGEALGHLDLALAKLPPDLAPIDWRGTLDAVHPAVPSVADLCTELERLLPAEDGVRRLRDQAEELDEDYLRLLDKLPVQIIHGDLATSNVLINTDGQVSAVLDFEIAGLDLRVTDLVAGLSMAVDWEDPARAAEQESAFRGGYQRVVTLDAAEEAAIPALLRRRLLGSAIWRAGRWRLGLSDLDDVRERLAAIPA